MKVLFVCSLYSPHIGGGAEITLKDLVQGVRAKGVEVAVLALGPERGLHKEDVDGVPVWRAGIKNLYFPYGKSKPSKLKRKLWHLLDVYNPLMKSYVREVIRAERPDLASCHNILGWSVSVWDTLSEEGVPILQVLHDQYLLCPRSTMFKKNNLCSKKCIICSLMRFFHPSRSKQVKAVVGVSNFILRKTLAYNYFQEASIREVIYNVRSFEGRNAIAESETSSCERVVFGFIGSLVPFKGIEQLLQSFRISTGNSWRLRIAGKGDAAYEKMLRHRFNDPRIEFVGYCSQENFFSSVDITVVPSLWEDTFPGVVFESLIFGVPVIGSRRGGIPEMIMDGVNGFLFDPSDETALSSVMAKAADLIGSFDRSAVRGTAEKFIDYESWCSSWLNLYGKILFDDR